MKWIGGSRDAEIDLQAADCGLHASMKWIGGSRDAEIDCDLHAAVGQGAA